jgi:hypothetical protein
MTLPIAVLAGFAPLLTHTLAGYKENGLEGAGRYSVSALTGYDTAAHVWRPMEMRRGLLPITLGVLIHKYIGGKMGVNAALSRSGVPLLRL